MIRRPVPTGHDKLGPQVNEWLAQWRADRELLEELEAKADPRPMGTNRGLGLLRGGIGNGDARRDGETRKVMNCGSKCAKPHGHVGLHDFELGGSERSYKPEGDRRWWDCFFKAMELLPPNLLNSPKDDRGARVCAEFADQALVEAAMRGLV